MHDVAGNYAQVGNAAVDSFYAHNAGISFAAVDGSLDFDEFTASLAPRYCNFRKTSIYAGSNEIQRNIIAKMALGL